MPQGKKEFTPSSSALAAPKEPLAQYDAHILVAEDNPQNQRLIRMLLGKLGIEVSLAENGQRAVELALEKDIDLILMDIRMPVMGGLEAIALLREAGFAEPIIALTANVTAAELDEYQVAGCEACLPKPIDTEQLFSTLETFLSSMRRSVGESSRASNKQAPSDALISIINSFKEGLPGTLKALDAAFSAQQWDVIGDEAHRLKGIAASMGFPEITDIAAQLEVAAARQQSAGVQACLRVLHDASALALRS